MKILHIKFFRLLILFAFILLYTEQSNAAEDSLKYLANAFVKIKTSDGKVICIDPNLVNEFADSVDVLLITHEHGDHNDVSRVKRRQSCVTIRVVNAIVGGVYQIFTIGNIVITAVPAYNGYHQKTSSVGYIIEFNGIKIYHPGDTGKITEMSNLAAQSITYALLPMDGTYTMTPEQATEAAAMIQAKYDVPIHTIAGSLGYSDQMVNRFTSPNKLVVRPGTTIALTNAPTSIEGTSEKPESFNLFQNYPNPFNPATNFEYRIPSASAGELVTLKVYDVLGNEVIAMINDVKEAGTYTVKFDASNLTSGVYFYELKAGTFRQTKKMMLLR